MLDNKDDFASGVSRPAFENRSILGVHVGFGRMPPSVVVLYYNMAEKGITM